VLYDIAYGVTCVHPQEDTDEEPEVEEDTGDNASVGESSHRGSEGKSAWKVEVNDGQQQQQQPQQEEDLETSSDGPRKTLWKTRKDRRRWIMAVSSSSGSCSSSSK